MQHYYIISICLIILTLAGGCEEKEVMSQDKGKVFFISDPTINNDTIQFIAAIQFYPPGGKPVDIEYQLLDDTMLVREGSAYTRNNITTGDYDNFVFATDTIEVIISPAYFTEETIDILLDPDEKVTHEDFATEEDIILRHYSINIP